MTTLQRPSNRCPFLAKRFYRRILALAQIGLLHHLVEPFEALGEEGTSTDEEADRAPGGAPVYGILRKPWRSAELEAFCRFLDKMVVLDPYRKAPPNLTLRIPSNHISTRPPPSHLPRNWYAADWLAQLSEQKLYLLHPKDPVPLEIPDDLAR